MNEACPEQHAAALAERGHSVARDFVSAGEVRALAEDAAGLRAAARFRPARVGRGAGAQVLPEIRGDAIAWIDPAAPSPAQARLLARLERLRLALNRELQLGLFDLELHYALYPPGARYDRHLDCHRGARHRAVSLVLYLNQEWRTAHGGALRLWVGAQGAPACLDVEPAGGTLALFLSDRIEHEVLPSTRDRLAATGWFSRRR